MKKLTEYFDRLSNEQIRQLRDKFGGELAWKNKRFSSIEKEELGKIVFSVDVKNVRFGIETNKFSGHPIVIIFAEEK